MMQISFRKFLETNLTPKQWQSVNNFMVRKGYDWRGAEDAKRLMMGMMKDGEIDAEMFPDHAAALRSLHRQSVERSPEEKLLTRIKRHFGVTKDFRVAGYILSDGSMLNLSGSNRGSMNDTRGIDHREVVAVANSFGGHYYSRPIADLREFGEAFGAISLHYGNDYANLRICKAPTKKQMGKIHELRRLVSHLQLNLYRGKGERTEKMYGPKDYNYGIDLGRFFNEI